MSAKKVKTKRLILDLVPADVYIEIKQYLYSGEVAIFDHNGEGKVRMRPECGGSVEDVVFDPDEIESIVMSLRAARKLAKADM